MDLVPGSYKTVLGQIVGGSVVTDQAPDEVPDVRLMPPDEFTESVRVTICGNESNKGLVRRSCDKGFQSRLLITASESV